VTIHLLGLSLSVGQAVALAALLGLLVGLAVGWLSRDFRAWGERQDDDCNCDYARGAYWCDEHQPEAWVAWKQDPKPPVPREARITYK
jgi:hypothetical protein